MCTGLIVYVIVLNGQFGYVTDMTVVVECDATPRFIQFMCNVLGTIRYNKR